MMPFPVAILFSDGIGLPEIIPERTPDVNFERGARAER